MRCDDHVFTVLGAGTIEGVFLDWTEIPSFSKTSGFHRAPRGIDLFLLPQVVSYSVATTLWEVKKVLCLPVSLNAGCDAQLGSTAPRSLLPAATSALSGKKSPEWNKKWRTVGDNKTRQWSHTNLGLGWTGDGIRTRTSPDERDRFLYRERILRQWTVGE